MSKEEAQKDVEKCQELSGCFSDIEHYLSNAAALIDELSGAIEPEDALAYLGKMTGFMQIIASELDSFVGEIADGNTAELNFSFPTGIDPKSLFYS